MAQTCSYKDCFNQRFSKQITYFRLPKKNPEQRKKWILNSGNPELLTISDISQPFFCEQHFQEKDLRRQFHRTTLARDAVPIPYDTQQLNVSSSSTQKEDPSHMVFSFSLETEKEKLNEDTVVMNLDFKNDEETIKVIQIPENVEEESPPKKRLRLSDDEELLYEEVEVIEDRGIVENANVEPEKSPKTKPSSPLQSIKNIQAIKQAYKSNKSIQATPILNNSSTQSLNETKTLKHVSCGTDIKPTKDNSTQTLPQEQPQPEVKPSSSERKLDEDEYFCVNVLCNLLKKLPDSKKAMTKMDLLSLLYKADSGS